MSSRRASLSQSISWSLGRIIINDNSSELLSTSEDIVSKSGKAICRKILKIQVRHETPSVSLIEGTTSVSHLLTFSFCVFFDQICF